MLKDAVPKRVAFLSPSGGGNLGDAAIVDSLIHAIRRRIPGAEIIGFTGNPDDTVARHGVPAFHMRAPFGPTPGSAADGDQAGGGEGDGTAPRVGVARRVRRMLGAVPGARAGYKTVVHLVADHRHYGPVARRLGGFDFVVVAGGGQFDALFGGSFKHPYALWRYGAMARAAGARYVILSVGTGTLTPPSRLFVRRALALADYASFRDERSRQLVGDGAHDNPIVPDLAYALPLEIEIKPPSSAPARPVVGISPMAYGDPRAWPKQDLARYRRHVSSLAQLTLQIVRAGHEVVLFVTDGPDILTLEELRAQVLPHLGPEERARVRVPPVTGVPDLMRVLAGVDLVVAARLHGVLLAHVAGRPVLAISHERKVATLMNEVGHGRYCQDIDLFDPVLGWERFCDLSQRREALATEIRAAASDCRRRVEAQYDMILGTA